MATTKTKDDKRITDLQVRNLKGKISEPADKDQKRGFGTLLFERRPSGIVEAYYRQRVNGKDVSLKLGTYKSNPRAAGMTVSQIRDKANEYAAIAAERGDVKAFIEEQEAAAALKRAERQRLAEIEASRGSFGELFLDYIESRRQKATAGVVKELERLYQTNMLKPHPCIMAMKARDIRPDHILDILNPIWERGAKVQAERMRSFLSAAFNHGLRAENAVGRANAKSYNLENNPATVVAVEKVSAPATRALSDAELRHFWETIESTEGVGPVMALLFKFVISTGGQRIFNVCQTTWDDYDLEAGTVRLIHRKGRGGQTMSRPHLVPLSPRAVAIMERVREINGCHPWPWTTTGKQHIVVSSPRHAVADWLSSEHAVIEEKQIPSFSPRDLRRTCTQLMQRHGISDQLSDLLQAHGQTGVANLHYRNNPEAALPEKKRAIELFDRALAGVLGETSAQIGNVVTLKSRRGK
ncbi:tyrosine-type recombinase/integrase [Pseudomonas tumuqii]|uniref:tyrosine-type recombinase/integrase n=1 Tax=Pseudomonas tumuqii TaxID=2715755 RepID=UPI0015537D5D|nr:integrase family protein [Pseudomonas tumuqii]